MSSVKKLGITKSKFMGRVFDYIKSYHKFGEEVCCIEDKILIFFHISLIKTGCCKLSAYSTYNSFFKLIYLFQSKLCVILCCNRTKNLHWYF